MDDLSLYLLDIVQNSLKAEADTLNISIEEDTGLNRLTMIIADNGSGMNEEVLAQVLSPFFTTRTTRSVGLGLSFLKMAANLADGDLTIESKVDQGTIVTAWFTLNHINTPPLGNLAETIYTIIIHPQLKDLKYVHIYDHQNFIFDLGTITTILDGVPLTDYQVMKYLKSYINDNVDYLRRKL
jgi:hypothetical protein